MEVHEVARPRRRRMRRLLLVPGTVALVLVSALVWQSSYAGFGDSAPPISTSVSTGAIRLTNGVAFFGSAISLGEVLPGDTESYCILVRSTGTARAEVRLYGTGKSTTKALDKYVSLSWVAGTGGGLFGDCGGFVPNTATSTTTLNGFQTSWATGVLPWTLAGTGAVEDRTYRLTYTVDPKAPATSKGGTVTVTFVWEAQTQ